MTSTKTLIVGIDFGTTSTGISYVFAQNRSEVTPENAQIKIIEGWCPGNGALKTPSKILYHGKDEFVCGFEARRNNNSISMLKLLLLDAQDVPMYLQTHEEYRHSKAKIAALGKTGVGVVSDYLWAAWDKFQQEFTDAYGSAPLAESSLEFIFTVPAIWPAYYRQRLREAIQRAGLLEDRPRLAPTSLRFITEPEAAAYMTIQDKILISELVVNDVFMVVDCGGATIDVISYQIVSLDPLQIKEFVPGDGGLYGACIVDGAFEEALKAKCCGAFDWNIIRENRKFMHNVFDLEWENELKCSFTGARGCSFEPAWPFFNLSTEFTAHELRQIFQPARDGIIDIVQHQIYAIQDKARSLRIPLLGPKFIRLAGGFGRNPYIFNALQETFEKRKNIKIMSKHSGGDLWSLILRGAALFGVMGNDLVRSRILRESLAVECNTPFIEAEHKGQEIEFDLTRQQWVVPGQLSYFFRKGDEVEDSGIRTTELELSFPVNARGRKELDYPIWSSPCDSPPTSLSARRSATDLRSLGFIRYKTPPMLKLPIYVSEGEENRYLQYKLQAKGVSGREVELSAIWVEDGSTIGTMMCSVEAE